jgi:nicotinamidase/pyrazinamidase
MKNKDQQLIWEAYEDTQQGDGGALLLIDIQNDFMPGGALAVDDGNAVVPVANRMMDDFQLIVATRDWHPKEHVSFASNHEGRDVGEIVDTEIGLKQFLWPDHCVQGTQGADLVSALDTSQINQVFQKGMDINVDSYSGFFDAAGKELPMGSWLKRQGVKSVHLVGVATDYCVKFTALDAVKLGFDTHLHLDGVRGVDLPPGNMKEAMSQMQAAGVNIHD